MARQDVHGSDEFAREWVTQPFGRERDAREHVICRRKPERISRRFGDLPSSTGDNPTSPFAYHHVSVSQ